MDVRLAELMCSRLCHDLAGPLGAARNGLELLDELGAGPLGDESAAMVGDSLKTAHARLQFFRLAYGTAGHRTTDGFQQLRETALNWLNQDRLTLDWPVHAPQASVAERTGVGKLILNLLLLACDVLPHGGTIRIDGYGDTDSGEVTVQASGTPLKWTPEMAAPFTGPDTRIDEHSAATIQPVVCKMFADFFGLDLTIDAKPGLCWQATLFW